MLSDVRRRLLCIALMAFTASLAAAGGAAAARPETPPDGPYCTRAGCAGAPRSTAANAGAFAAAALASALGARRRRVPSR
jgi:hypothetical protein